MSEDYFVYCMTCEKRVKDPSQVCSGCNTSKDMVDWPEPVEDCTQVINGQDCIERNESVPCTACVDWCAWETIRTAE